VGMNSCLRAYSYRTMSFAMLIAIIWSW